MVSFIRHLHKPERLAVYIRIVILNCMGVMMTTLATSQELTIPPTDVPVAAALEVPDEMRLERSASWQLEQTGKPATAPIAAQLSDQPDGKLALCFVVPAGKGSRRFRLVRADRPEADAFRFEDVDDKQLRLLGDDGPVLAYNYGNIQAPDGGESLWRSCYLHPIHGLDGEVLTDDFPSDHRHHRGLFWTWARVLVGDQEHDLWALRGCDQRFDRVLHQDAGAVCATLGVTNRWFAGDTPIVRETVWVRAFRAGAVGRAIDVDLTLEAIDQIVSIAGREEKGYGGMTLRFGPREDTVITTSSGKLDADSLRKPFPWADLSARLRGREQVSGAALFDHPANPGYPNEWMLRHYGILDCTWPGVELHELKPGEPVRLRYRLWVHRGDVESGKVAAAHHAFVSALNVTMR